MVRVINAFTTEIDEADDALKEILDQVDLKALDKHSVGIISCNYEFIDTGVVQKICENLPFELVGFTTMASASGGDYGVYRLNLTVLTSEDVSFETAYTAPLSGADYEKSLEEAYSKARSRLPSDPSFIITLFPLINDLSSADILKAFDRISGGIPIWGTCASDAKLDSDHCRTIGMKKTESASAGMILVHGAIEPEFIVTSIPDRNISTRTALVTKSSGCIIKEANGVPFTEYLNSIGYATKVGSDFVSIPLILRYPDGSGPVALGVYSVYEDGSAMIGGEVPEGTSFAGSEIDSEGIIETAKVSIDKALKTGKKSGVLMFPCVTRYLMLAPASSKEMELAISAIGDIPYVLAYAGGEICPIRGEDGKLHNHFHNYTFSLCVL